METQDASAVDLRLDQNNAGDRRKNPPVNALFNHGTATLGKNCALTYFSQDETLIFFLPFLL